MDKKEILEKLSEEVKEIPERDKSKFFGRFFVSIISALSQRLIRYEGYSVTRKILEREITEVGKRDAKDIMKIFSLQERTPDNVSKSLKIAALILGFKLEVLDGETVVKECPFAMMAKSVNEPLIAEICSWYCSGIATEILGEDYKWLGTHDITKDVPICFFKHIKRE